MNTTLTTSRTRWQKLWRYSRVYGWKRALVKAAGRGGILKTYPGFLKRGRPSVSFIGCGQAAFGTLCYFLAREKGGTFLEAYDPDKIQAARLAQFYRFKHVSDDVEELLSNPQLETVYVASNHSSHAAYAVAALQRGVQVFIEKPVCTSWNDLDALEKVVTGKEAAISVGYNRPHSAIVTQLRARLAGIQRPLTMACYVHGHTIPPGHWYRQSAEGGRIMGNAGHWLDLAVHMLTAIYGRLPTEVEAQYLAASADEPDDNFSLALRTPAGDLITLHMASRNEPFEGIRETIEIQCGGISAQIDDFRRLRVWEGTRFFQKKYRPKDVGHRTCTMQPFACSAKEKAARWGEVVVSTRLMLHIAALASRGDSSGTVLDLTRAPAAAPSFEGG